MANETLKRFLIERLLDLDPSLDDSEGSLMYMKVIDPLIKRLGTDPLAVDIGSFIVARLADEFPDLDATSPGSVIRDVLVNPLALILEPLQREIEFLRLQNSLGDSDALTEVELDALLSNVLSERKYGDYSRGLVRVYFTTARSVGVDSSIVFSTASGFGYVPEEAFTYAPSDMTRSGSQYYIDIPVRSQLPDAATNIGVGEIRFVNGLSGVARVANLNAFTGGVTQETNADFLVRAERSLSERSLNTKRGIETAILNNFSDIVSVQIVGHGEPDMKRDVLQARVKQVFDEDIGPLIYMTANWKTHALWSNSSTLPFTNTIKIMPPGGGSFLGAGEWPADLKAALLEAKYIRVADGSGLTWSHCDLDPLGVPHEPLWGDSDGNAGVAQPFRKNTYNDTVLNRIRAVDETFYNDGNDYAIYIKLKDFEIYPSPPSITNDVPFLGTADTSAPEMGLNKRSNQGSAFKMIGESGGVETVLGAHLPFTDHVHTSFVPNEVPGSVVVGRDFLFSFTNTDLTDQNENGDSLGFSYPKMMQMWPLTKFYSSTDLGIGRIDSFLVSKNRAVYPGKDEFVFDSSPVFSLFREHLKIIDFGGPKSSDPDPEVRFDGETAEDLGRNPGCMIQAMNDLGGANPHQPITSTWGTFPHPGQVDIILDSTQTKWANRGVTEGHYISCSVYSLESAPGTPGIFDGNLSNVEGQLQWQGWGRIVKVGAGTPWRIRVEGMDFGPLHENNFGHFSPSASMIVTVPDPVPQLPTANSASPDVITVTVGGVHIIDITTQWGGGGVNASTTLTFTTAGFTPGGGPYNGGIIDIDAPLTAAGTVTVDDSASSYATLDLWVAGLAAAIDTDPTAGFFTSASALGPALTITCDLFGRYGNTMNAANCTQNGANVGAGFGLFTGGDEPTAQELAVHMASEITANIPNISAEALSDGRVRIFSDNPGSTDNNTPVTILHTDLPAVDLFALATWNLNAVLQGGFDYAFGPLAQVGVDQNIGAPVPGANAPDLAAGSAEEFDHEELTPNPDPVDGMSSLYTLVAENSPIQRGSLRLHYWDVGPDGGAGTQVVWDDDSDGNLVEVIPGAGYLASSQIDYSSGTVAIVFAPGFTPRAENMLPLAGNHPLPLFSIGYNYYLNPFKAYWTVYRGEVETISPSGDLGVSYDDFSFAPAYKRPGPDGTNATANGAVAARGPCYYEGDRWQVDFNGHLGSTYRFSSGVGAINQREAVWVRLGKSFEQQHPSLGGPPVTRCLSGEVINFDRPSVGINGNPYGPGYSTVDQLSYCEKRYPAAKSSSLGLAKDVDNDAVVDSHFVTRTPLPLVAGATRLVDPSDQTQTDFDLDEMSFINYAGSFGFLLPHPMGPAHYGEPGNLDNSEFDYLTNNIALQHLLDHQVLQVYEGASGDMGDTGIVVSGIPGSVPFPGWFGGDFEIENDKIHIGGMTDVYVKATAAEERTTPPIRLQPEALDPDALPAPSPTDPPPEYEVLLQATDGAIDSAWDDTHFDSLALLSAIATHYGAAGIISLDNLVIELLDVPSPDLQPRFFRAIHTTATGVKVDGAFPAGAAYAGMRFRALFGCTTSIDKPLIVLQQGADLIVQKNDFSVFCPTGFDFGTDPADVAVYISIDSIEARGEYRVTGKNLNTLVTETAITESGSALSYRVYTKQAAGVDLPLVRVKSVSLSGDEVEGVSVPYKNPVDIIASSFAGLNDDPINEESLGNNPFPPTLEVLSYGGEPRLHLIVDDNEDFVTEYKTIRYDVLRIETLDEPNKYFYVEDFVNVNTGGGTGFLNALVLDRTISGLSSAIENVQFSLGRPAVGTAQLVFKDPTFFEAGPDTEFSYVSVRSTPGIETAGDDKTYKFRPSPLESAVLYKTGYTTTDLTIDGTLDNAKIYSLDVNFLKHDIKVGDRLTILTRVMRSAAFNGAAPFLDDENLSLAGKTLVINIDGAKKSVVFSGPNPTTLEQAVSDINRQVGDKLKAAVIEPDPTGSPEEYFLQISSNLPIELTNDGTIGILTELRVNTDLIHRDNNYYPAGGGAELFDPYLVTAVNYIDKNTAPGGVARWELEITSVDGGQPTPVTDIQSVFVEARRYKYQRIYPSDMTDNGFGLYTAPVTLTSYDPNTPTALITDNTQLSVEGHKSLGYEMIVKNANYSYSLGEECSLRTTSVVLSDVQDSFDTVYPLPGADVTITYDRSQVVSDIQGFLLSPSLRVVCNNPLSRHFFPAYPIGELNYGDTRLSPTEVQGILEEHFKTLYPNAPLELYDISAIMARKGVGYIQFPQVVEFLLHDENRVLKVARSVDIIYLNKRFHIMEDLAGITVNKVT